MQTVTIIGLGNLGYHLAEKLLKLEESYFQLTQIYSSQKNLNFKGQNQLLITDDFHKLLETDLVLITVPDSQILEVSNHLKLFKSLIVHTSGSTDINVLPSLRKGVFYPLQTFSKAKTVDWLPIPIFVESNTKKDLDLLKQFAQVLSEKVYEVDSHQRQFLHLAAIFCCNFTNHLYHLGAEILAQNNLPFNMMLPLIKETTEKVFSLSPKAAQTGPAIRRDLLIMQKHENLLAESQKNLYIQLSDSIIKLNEQK